MRITIAILISALGWCALAQAAPASSEVMVVKTKAKKPKVAKHKSAHKRVKHAQVRHA